jgi:hypothetical protein
MDIFNLIKIITTIIATVIALIVGIRVLFLNRNDWLNRWFTIFFISSSLGFLSYTIYHIILNNAHIIIPIMITAQLFFNFNGISLTMTVFVLEKFTKVAMSFKYLGRMMILFFIMSVGYFIWIPELDTVSYALGIVNTTTSLGLVIFVNTIRIILCIYVVYKYSTMVRKIESETKKRMQWFTKGVIFVILGILINLTAAVFEVYIQMFIEILALVLIDVGALLIFKGFLIK